jgi:hypothetical protein
MNFAGWAYLISVWCPRTKSQRLSIALMRLLQSEEPRSVCIYLSSSMICGSTGFDTRLFFLKEFELAVVLKPYDPPVVVITELPRAALLLD